VGKGGGSVTANGTLKQIYKLLSDKFEQDNKLREIDKNFEEEENLKMRNDIKNSSMLF
jgi:hypothetical protein